MSDRDGELTGGSFPTPNVDWKRHDLKKMNERHHQIVRYSMLGYKNKQIAEKLGITPESVGQVLSSSLVQIKREQLRGASDAKAVDIMDDIQRILPGAVKLLGELVNGGSLFEGAEYGSADRALQAKASKDLLGIGGYSPVKRTESRNINATLTSDEVGQMVAEAKALGISCGDVVEAEYTEKSD